MRKKVIAGVGVAAVVAAGGALLGTTIAGAETGVSTANGFAACIASGNHLKNNQIFPINRAPKCSADETLYTWPSAKGTTEALDALKADIQTQLDALAKVKNPISATASTQVSDRQDGGHGNPSVWALDQVTRTVTVVGSGPVAASHCGVTSGPCFFYTGQVTDAGSFTTVAGAKSPHAGAAVNGALSGSLNGVLNVEFYATSNDLAVTRVPATASGNTVATGDWAHQLFPGGTHFSASDVTEYHYLYSAPSTCEQWNDSSDNGDGTAADAGDIVGVNACTQ